MKVSVRRGFQNPIKCFYPKTRNYPQKWHPTFSCEGKNEISAHFGIAPRCAWFAAPRLSRLENAPRCCPNSSHRLLRHDSDAVVRITARLQSVLEKRQPILQQSQKYVDPLCKICTATQSAASVADPTAGTPLGASQPQATRFHWRGCLLLPAHCKQVVWPRSRVWVSPLLFFFFLGGGW